MLTDTLGRGPLFGTVFGLLLSHSLANSAARTKPIFVFTLGARPSCSIFASDLHPSSSSPSHSSIATIASYFIVLLYFPVVHKIPFSVTIPIGISRVYHSWIVH
ncbi:hypothetical protein TWF569_006621 [Orbilia oligospora]|uniref:Uncharacterized protein n=1 Tax=Orbilia oligospora TaxID=2813651 RepID=A0A7C8J1B3_ORBOL|nr:hypothetical protein TWF103_003266 [Orbilia oligospora]KAF3087419.1 hypothetical protein TWF102_010490 [Orbilia oligospora]KAF3102243.1 hypothetical protein TWF706_005388 [Orbilia oligospora]KAF3124026.1 hypothetical protein TWF594_002138 [Orbilia oligospora]KAF3145566.1 hypothetical protein TWF569_006621 [Orbilia oligospora]